MRKDLPSGTVTFLFSDIEESTRLLREHPDLYDELLDLHNHLLRDAWAAHRGVEVNTEGDAFFVAFADAGDALAAAVDGQRRLAAADWPGGRPMRVRMGVHSGYGRPVDGDYRALAVNQAARVVGAANGGQILATAEVVELAEPAAAGVELTALGSFRVRDFDESVELYRVSAVDLELDERAPRVRPADSHNLLRPATSLINRQRELDDLARIVQPGELVTMLGPGGAGKTRLSIEVGFSVVDRWPDGVWFVDLAPVTVGEVVPVTIANTVSAPSTHGNDAMTDLVDHLADRTALLVLDNCEHLVEPVARMIDELRRRCPGLGMLATSRLPLGLLGEQLYRLEPLGTDGADSDGVRLFLERSGFDAGGDLTDVIELCRAVDGLPLAIELVAGRSNVASPAELVQRIGQGVAVVATRDPTLPGRQRSLDRLLDWTIELLGDDERLLLGRLAVIADSFDLALAEAVAGDETLPVVRIPELLWNLLDWSLLIRDSASGNSRYTLLGTVRAHMRQRADRDELAGARRRLADALMERLGPRRGTTRQWVIEMGVELDNLRAVIDDDTTPDDIARSLAWSLGTYHDVTSTYRTGIAEVARCIGSRPAPGSDLVALLVLQAFLHLRLAETAEAEGLVDAAASLADEVGQPPWDDACVERTRGELALRSNDPAGAVRLAEGALRAGVATQRAEARLWNLVALGHHAVGDMMRAADALDHCLRAEYEAGLETFHAGTHGNYAEALLALGDREGAVRHQLASLDYARSMGQTLHVAFACMFAARLAADDDDLDDAVRIESGAEVILDREGYQLYGRDAQMRADLLDSAREALGVAAFDAARDDGRTTPLDRLADRATVIMRRHTTAPVSGG
jgi:predicted ATPase/class 3 adenylate cyclase